MTEPAMRSWKFMLTSLRKIVSPTWIGMISIESVICPPKGLDDAHTAELRPPPTSSQVFPSQALISNVPLACVFVPVPFRWAIESSA